MIETTESSAVLNICEYVFSVSSLFLCPKYFATNVILAPDFINTIVLLPFIIPYFIRPFYIILSNFILSSYKL